MQQNCTDYWIGLDMQMNELNEWKITCKMNTFGYGILRELQDGHKVLGQDYLVKLYDQPWYFEPRWILWTWFLLP